MLNHSLALISDFAERAPLNIRNILISLPQQNFSNTSYIYDSFSEAVKRIQDIVFSQRHVIFFSAGTALSFINSPKLFFCGFAIGFTQALLAERIYQRDPGNNDSFVGSSVFPEASAAQMTLGVVTLIANTFFSQPHLYPFYLGQDGTTSSLLSGFIAGTYAASVASFLTNKFISYIRS